jgi:hypothetical protein
MLPQIDQVAEELPVFSVAGEPVNCYIIWKIITKLLQDCQLEFTIQVHVVSVCFEIVRLKFGCGLL